MHIRLHTTQMNHSSVIVDHDNKLLIHALCKCSPPQVSNLHIIKCMVGAGNFGRKLQATISDSPIS